MIGTYVTNRTDILSAYYLYFSEYNTGQFKHNAERLSKLLRYYEPPTNISIDTLSPMAQLLYMELVVKALDKLKKS